MIATRPQTLQSLLDRAEISDTVLRYATGVDMRDWALHRSVFAEDVEMDFSSWNGREPQRWRADDWVAMAKSRMSGFDSTRHYSSNHVHVITGDEATCVSYMAACHYLVERDARRMHTVFGHYTNRLRRSQDQWLIHACRFTFAAERGEREIHERAYAKYMAAHPEVADAQ